MSGPVWRFAGDSKGRCDICFREGSEFFLEGEVHDKAYVAGRRVCPECYRRSVRLIVAGEVGATSTSPAYFDRS